MQYKFTPVLTYDEMALRAAIDQGRLFIAPPSPLTHEQLCCAVLKLIEPLRPFATDPQVVHVAWQAVLNRHPKEFLLRQRNNAGDINLRRVMALVHTMYRMGLYSSDDGTFAFLARTILGSNHRRYTKGLNRYQYIQDDIIINKIIKYHKYEKIY